MSDWPIDAEVEPASNVLPFRRCAAEMPGDHHEGRLFPWEGDRLCRACWRSAFDRWTPPAPSATERTFMFFSRLR